MTENPTQKTYDYSAEKLAKFFEGIGPRTEDIERAFDVLGRSDPVVLEIGCGDGRDAEEIVPKASSYTGIDLSKGMIELAEKRVINGKFEVADMVEYDYPEGVDIVFAFASILHLPEHEVEKVFTRIHQALNPGGIFYISTKERAKAEKEFQKDIFGERVFYYYPGGLIIDIASEFELVYENHYTIGQTTWVDLAFRKEND